MGGGGGGVCGVGMCCLNRIIPHGLIVLHTRTINIWATGVNPGSSDRGPLLALSL